MRGLQQIGQARSNTAKLDEGIKLTTFIPVHFVRHKARKVVVEPTTPGRVKNKTELAKVEKISLARMQKGISINGHSGLDPESRCLI